MIQLARSSTKDKEIIINNTATNKKKKIIKR